VNQEHRENPKRVGNVARKTVNGGTVRARIVNGVNEPDLLRQQRRIRKLSLIAS